LKNYKDSDYALNKFSEGIVYRFADRIVEITLEETEQLAAPPLDLDLIHKSDTRKAKEAAKRLLDSGELTEIQRRRFILHFFQNVSLRQIAKKENVHQSAVWESLQWALKKLRKLFDGY